MSVTWGHSILDWRSHAIDDRRDHPDGVFRAECGHRLMTSATLRDEPHGPPCEACAAGQLALAVTRWWGDKIPGRPPVEPVPVRFGSPRPAVPQLQLGDQEPTSEGDRHGR